MHSRSAFLPLRASRFCPARQEKNGAMKFSLDLKNQVTLHTQYWHRQHVVKVHSADRHFACCKQYTKLTKRQGWENVEETMRTYIILYSWYVWIQSYCGLLSGCEENSHVLVASGSVQALVSWIMYLICPKEGNSCHFSEIRRVFGIFVVARFLKDDRTKL